LRVPLDRTDGLSLTDQVADGLDRMRGGHAEVRLASPPVDTPPDALQLPLRHQARKRTRSLVRSTLWRTLRAADWALLDRTTTATSLRDTVKLNETTTPHRITERQRTGAFRSAERWRLI